MTGSSPQIGDSDRMPNGWSKKLYDKSIASQDLGFHASSLAKVFDQIPSKIEQLKKAVVRAYYYGDLSMNEIVEICFGQLDLDDIRKILQEEEDVAERARVDSQDNRSGFRRDAEGLPGAEGDGQG